MSMSHAADHGVNCTGKPDGGRGAVISVECAIEIVLPWPLPDSQ
jgi:hypothetical protein